MAYGQFGAALAHRKRAIRAPAIWRPAPTCLACLTMAARQAVMVFDVDGTLVDSNDAHARAWVETLRMFGIERDVAAARRLVGMGGDKLLPALAGIEAESDLGRRITERRSAHFRRTYLDSLRPFGDTRALFEALRARGVRLAVASYSDQQDLDRLLEIAAVSDLIERRASADA